MAAVSEVYDRDEQLEKSIEAMEVMEDAFEEALLAYADAESAYRIRRSDEYLKAEGTEKAREAQAILAVAKLLQERNRAEAVKDFVKAKMKDRQEAVSARQSLLSSARRTNERF